MDDQKTLEELIEERRAEWGTRAMFTPVPAAEAVSASGEIGLGELEDTMPLPRYRAERL